MYKKNLENTSIYLIFNNKFKSLVNTSFHSLDSINKRIWQRKQGSRYSKFLKRDHICYRVTIWRIIVDLSPIIFFILSISSFKVDRPIINYICGFGFLLASSIAALFILASNDSFESILLENILLKIANNLVIAISVPILLLLTILLFVSVKIPYGVIFASFYIYAVSLSLSLIYAFDKKCWISSSFVNYKQYSRLEEAFPIIIFSFLSVLSIFISQLSGQYSQMVTFVAGIFLAQAFSSIITTYINKKNVSAVLCRSIDDLLISLYKNGSLKHDDIVKNALDLDLNLSSDILGRHWKKNSFASPEIRILLLAYIDHALLLGSNTTLCNKITTSTICNYLNIKIHCPIIYYRISSIINFELNNEKNKNMDTSFYDLKDCFRGKKLAETIDDISDFLFAIQTDLRQ